MAIDLQELMKDIQTIDWNKINNIFGQIPYLSIASGFPWPLSEPVLIPFDTIHPQSGRLL